MKNKNIIEMPSFYFTNEVKVKSIFATYKKINTENFSFNDLNEEDIQNIENFYSALCIMSDMGMFLEYQQMIARSEIEWFIGRYPYPTEMYSCFITAYDKLLEYQIENNILEDMEKSK